MSLAKKFYLVRVADDYYYSLITDAQVDPNTVFFTLAEAEEAMKTNRGDTLFVAPGEHLVTEQITWDKSQTKIKGLGGPNQR